MAADRSEDDSADPDSESGNNFIILDAVIEEDDVPENEFEEHMWESDSEDDNEAEEGVDPAHSTDEDNNPQSEEEFDDEHSMDDQYESDEDVPIEEQEQIGHMMEILEFNEGRPRSMPTQTGRRGRNFAIRRPVVDVVGMGPDGVELRWAESLDQDNMDDFQILGRPLTSLRPNHADDMTSHPFLQNNEPFPSSAVPSQHVPSQEVRRGSVRGNLLDQLRMNDGENALQILEQMFSRGPPRSDRQDIIIAIDRSNNSRALLENANRVGSSNIIFGTQRVSNGPDAFPSSSSSVPTGHADENTLLNDNLKKLLSHTLSFTDDRWKLEARLVYGNLMNEKAQKSTNAILNLLVPPAKEEARLKKEEEDRKIEEERAAKLAEDKRLEAEAEKEKAEKLKVEIENQSKDEILIEVDSSINPEPSTEANAPQEPEERITIMINGEDVDITGTI